MIPGTKQITLILLISLFYTGFAQNLHVRFDHYDVEDGLSDNTVNDILQDHKGHLWIGTQNGLDKFDGFEFIKYRHHKGHEFTLAGNTVQSLLLDSKERLWVGTFRGLVEYDYGKDHFNGFDSDNELIKTGVSDLIEDKNGQIIVATNWRGIYCFDGQKITQELNTQTNKEFISNNTTALALDKEGDIYVGTNIGLFKVSNDFESVTPLLTNYPPNASSIQSLTMDKEGVLWIGTTVGLVRYDPKSNQSEYFFYDQFNPFNFDLHKSVTSIVEAGENILWLGTDNNGIIYFNKDDLSMHVYSSNKSNNHLSSNHIKSLFIDRDNSLWVGTYSGGLNFSNIRTNMFMGFLSNGRENNGLKEGAISSFAQDTTGKVWVGVNPGGLHFLDEDKDYFTQARLSELDPMANQIVGIEKTKNHTFLIVSFEGRVYHFNPYTQEAMLIEEASSELGEGAEVNFVHSDMDGDIWIGSNNGGLLRLSSELDLMRHYKGSSATKHGLQSDMVTSYSDGPSGTKWFGTFNGLYSYDSNTDRFKLFKLKENEIIFSDNVITTLHSGPEDILWIGTGDGLYQYHTNTKEFKGFKKEDGLLSNVITAIEHDPSKRIWISTDNGLCQFALDHSNIMNAYNKSDGLHGTEFIERAAYHAADGRLFFGGNQGFSIIYPQTDLHERAPMQIHFTGLKILHETVIPDSSDLIEDHIDEISELVLDYYHSSITLEYTAINFINAKKTNYAYKLEGFDDKWHYVGHTKLATYTNLDPGEYTFLVKANTGEQSWPKESFKTLKIVITPPYWMTWWFRLLVISVVVISIYLIFRFRIRAVKAQNRELEMKVQERTREIVNQKAEIEDSIQVGKLIQQTMLPPVAKIKERFDDAFVLYKPKDIVSGDFYWFHTTDTHTYVVAADCTGHGVAGAFLTVIGLNHLTEIVNDPNGDHTAAGILNSLNERVISTLKQKDKGSKLRDGMDITMCVFEKGSKTVQLAGAINGIFIKTPDGELKKEKVDYFSIGIPIRGDVKSFKNIDVPIEKGDTIYMSSDGIIDQFGGEDGFEKFKTKRYRALIDQIAGKELDLQKEIVDEELKRWMDGTEQTDDIILIGIKV